MTLDPTQISDEPLQPKEQIILDWYDGIIAAIVKLFDEPHYYLVNLIAWEIDLTQARIYAVKRVTMEGQNKILNFVNSKSEEISRDNFKKLEMMLTTEFKSNEFEIFIFKSEGDIIIKNVALYPFKKIDISLDIDEISRRNKRESEELYALLS